MTRGELPSDKRRLRPETLIWGLVVLLAAFIRFYRIGQAPLDVTEASVAWSAWEASQRGTAPSFVGPSPFLLVVTSGIFAISGCASGALARLWPAISGTLLVAVPLLLRSRLGRAGALGTGLLLAISPVAVTASRRLDGATGACLGVALAVAAALRYIDTGRRSWFAVAACSLGLALACGPAHAWQIAVAMSVALIGALGVPMLAERQGGTPAWHSGIAQALRSDAPGGALLVAASLVVFSTGLGWNPRGLSAAANAWVGWGGVVETAVVSIRPTVVVLVYEPLVLCLAVAGMLCAWRAGSAFLSALGYWALAAFAVGGVVPSAVPGAALLVSLPLAFVAGVAVDRIARWSSCQESGVWRPALYSLATVLLWGHTYLALARYAHLGTMQPLLLTALAICLQVVLGLAFATLLNGRQAFHAFSIGASAVLVLWTLASSIRAAHFLAGDPREFVDGRSSGNVAELVSTLMEMSLETYGVTDGLQVAVATSEAREALLWHLRDFHTTVRDVGDGRQLWDVMGADTGTDVVLTAADYAAAARPTDTGYVGHTFHLSQSWNPANAAPSSIWPPDFSASASWLLFREAPGVAPACPVSVWVRRPLVAPGLTPVEH